MLTGFIKKLGKIVIKFYPQCPNREDKVDLHFIAFVHFDGILYELGMYLINIFY